MLFLALVALALVVNLWGYPAWARRRIENAILPPEEGLCIIGWLKGDPLTGFEIEDVILDRSTPVGLVHVEIPSMKLQLSAAQLFALQTKPTRLAVENAKVCLYQNRADAIHLHSLTGLLRVNSHDTLQGSLSAHSAGIHLRLDATLYNGSHLAELLSSSDRTPEEQAELAAKVRNALNTIQQELSQITFGTNDTFLHATVCGDTLKPETLSIRGEYGITDAIAHGVVIPKHRGHFSFDDQSIRLDNLQLLFSSREVIQGNAEYNLRTQKLDFAARGQVFPTTILQLANVQGAMPGWLRFQLPIEFDVSLSHSGDNWRDLRPTMSFSCDALQIAGLEIHQCSGQLSLQDQRVCLDHAQMRLDFRGQEILQGEAAWDFAAQQFSGRLGGNVNLPRILQELGIVSLQDSRLELRSNTEFKVVLQPSPLDWTQWTLSGTIRQPKIRVETLPFLNTELEFRLQSGELTFDKVHSCLQSGDGDTLLNARLKCRLPELFSGNRRTAVDLHAWLALQTSEVINATPFAEITGTVYADLQKNTLAVANGHVALLPQSLARQLTKILSVNPSYPLDWIHSRQPGAIDFDIPEWPLNNAGEFQLTGRLHFDDCVFQKIPLSQLDASFVATTHQFQMERFALASHDHNPEVNGRFTIEYSPFAITFGTLDYRGDPRFVTPFLIKESVKTFYREIWEPIDWSDAQNAHFQFDQLEFRLLPDQLSWTFNLQGSADAEDFHYRQVRIPRAHCRMDLSMPNGGMHFGDIVLDTPNPEDPTCLTGEAHFRLAKDDIIGSFDLHFHEGELDMLSLLCNVAEPLKPLLAPVELSPRTYFDAHADFLLGANPNLRLTGSVESPQVKFHALEVQNLQAKWLATPQVIQWDCSNVEFYGGRLVTTGEYNHGNGTGQCLINVQDLPLAELVRVTASTFHEHGTPENAAADEAARNDSPGIQPGLLDAEAKLSFYLNWADRPIHIEGNGLISIHQADLWHLPLLTSLGNIISVGTFNFFSSDKISRLGTISRLKATVECQGNRIFIPEFKTDGTVVALTGSGEYNLRNNQMDFLVSGQFLKNFSIINWLLRPLSWAFKAELVGKPDDYEWHLRSGWRKLEDNDE